MTIITMSQKIINIYLGAYQYWELFNTSDLGSFEIVCFDRIKSGKHIIANTKFLIKKNDIVKVTEHYDGFHEAKLRGMISPLYLEKNYEVKRSDVTINIILKKDGDEYIKDREKAVEIFKEYGINNIILSGV